MMIGNNQEIKNSKPSNEQPLVIKKTTLSAIYFLTKAEIEVWDLQAYGSGVEYLLQIPIPELTEVEINLLKEIAGSNAADWEKAALWLSAQR